MYLAYVDESGDPGPNTIITRYFTLSALIVADSNWRIFLNKTKVFRQKLKNDFGIGLDAELHSTDLWTSGGDFRKLGLSYSTRAKIFRVTADFIRSAQEISILVVTIDKSSPNLQTSIKIGQFAWQLLLQRYENWLISQQDYGIVVNDEGHDKMLRLLIRKMRQYNPIPSHYGGYYQAPLMKLIEDPFERHSHHSYSIQLADICAYLARLRHDCTPKQASYKLNKLYKKMKPRYILVAAPSDNYGFKIYP